MIRKAAEMQVETRENMRGGRGAISFRHYFSKDEITARTRLCAELTMPPGASIGTHQHTGEDEVYIVTHGSGLLDDGSSKTRVAAGDAVLTGLGASHALINDTQDDLRLIAVIMCYA